MIHIDVKVTRFYAYFVTFIYFLPSKFIFLLSVNMYPEKKHYWTFLPTEIGKIPNQTPISITSADSLTFCALQCLKDVLRCLSVAYNSVTRNCYFLPKFYFCQSDFLSKYQPKFYTHTEHLIQFKQPYAVFSCFHQIKKTCKCFIYMYLYSFMSMLFVKHFPSILLSIISVDFNK